MSDYKLLSEHQEQVQLLHWLAMFFPHMRERTVASVNGAHTNQGAKLKADGMAKGYPDLAVDMPVYKYHGFRMEMKKCIGNELTKEQVVWLDRLEADRYAVAVGFGAVDAFAKAMAYEGDGYRKVIKERSFRRMWSPDELGLEAMLPGAQLKRHAFFYMERQRKGTLYV